jgi:signal peptidase I
MHLVSLFFFILKTQLIDTPYAYALLFPSPAFDKQVLATALTLAALVGQLILLKVSIRLPIGKTLFTLLTIFIITQVPTWIASRSLLRFVTVTETGMSPTLNPGDCLLVMLSSPLRYEPKRNQIILFPVPDSVTRRENWEISRIVGLPGDTLLIEEGLIYINDQVVGKSSSVLKSSNGKRYPIPDGVVYCLGDNPIISIDSRLIGLLPMNQIRGHVERIIYTAFPGPLQFDQYNLWPEDPPKTRGQLSPNSFIDG